MPSNSALYQFVSNNTVSSAQAHLQERLKELNANSDLLLNPRRRVHLSEEVAKEFKTSLPREQKLFHFSPGKPTTTPTATSKPLNIYQPMGSQKIAPARLATQL